MKNIFDKEFKSEKLLFRKLTLLDVDDIYEYTSDDKCAKHLSWDPHKNKKQPIEFINNTLSDYKINNLRYTWGIELKEEKKLIGVISIFNISYKSKRVEVSYILNPLFQGKGYMTEALNSIIYFIFHDIGFIRVQAKCTVGNISSEKLMKKVNMQREGVLRKYWYFKNEFKNVLLYSIIK